MNKLIAATAGAAAIGLGALTVGSLLPAGAVQDAGEDETTTTAEDGNGEYVRPREILADALAELVEAGTLTQAQADAVSAEVQERVDALPDRPRGPGHGHPGLRILRNGLEVAAGTIGIEVGELREAVASGESIADVAEANGVASQAVVDALVAAGNAALDEAVSNGRIEEERAAEIRENLPEHAQIFVDRNRPDRGDDTEG